MGNSSQPFSYRDLPEPKLPANDQMFRSWRGLLFLILKTIVRLIYHPRIEGRSSLANQPYLIIANHRSAWDPLVIMTVLKDVWPDWISKENLFKRRWLSNIFIQLGMIPVDRSLQDMQAMRRILTRLSDGRLLGLFPEGTRVRTWQDKIDNPPKSTYINMAARRGMKIQAISIEYRGKFFHSTRVRLLEPIDAKAALKQMSREELNHEIITRIYASMGEDYPSTFPSEEQR
ncbi:MAG: lysophospholipid acyltransferase family protein [Eubacteriales bacterium]|nr:lysophospholipid acyltransferase family protein [Eubacteriales bacterium]